MVFGLRKFWHRAGELKVLVSMLQSATSALTVEQCFVPGYRIHFQQQNRK